MVYCYYKVVRNIIKAEKERVQSESFYREFRRQSACLAESGRRGNFGKWFWSCAAEDEEQ